MDNRAADRHGEPGKKGFCFFQEDEDDFGLAVGFGTVAVCERHG